MPFIGGIKKVKSDINAKIIAKLKQDLTGAQKTVKKNIEKYIVDTQARDTDLLLNSIAVERDVSDDYIRFRAYVIDRPYPEDDENITSANYQPSEAPNKPAPRIDETGQTTTSEVAVLIMWGLGHHSKKGPRNFLGEGLLNSAKEFGLQDKDRVK